MNFSFSRRSFQIAAVSICFLLAGNATADEAGGKDAAQDAQYLLPDRMTEEDRTMLSEYSGSYNQCLTKTSNEQMNDQTDVRHIVDYAMKQCAATLEQLDQKMMARNFEPNFRLGYIHRVSKQGANIALRNAMVGMAARQSTTDTEAGPLTATPAEK
jgi:hypothetical protein